MEHIPTGIHTDEGLLRFGALNRIFTETEYGKRLRENIRFERYKPATVGRDTWEHLLGADVNNLRHMRLTYGLTRKFIDTEEHPPRSWKKEVPIDARFSEREQEDLLLAAIIHDWAEAVVGDITYELKTTVHEEAERAAFRDILQDIFGTEKTRVLAARIDEVVDAVVNDHTTKLGKAFNAIERIGYLRTCLRAWNIHKETTGELRSGLEWLANNVLLGQIIPLVRYAKVYPAVEIFLRENSGTITEAFNNMPENVFENYAAEARDDRKKHFEEARIQWNIFLNTL